jgi:hypothetical protein
MPTTLDTILEETNSLTPAEQILLARTLLERARAAENGTQKNLTDLRGAGKGLWKSAKEVDDYIDQERDSWDR